MRKKKIFFILGAGAVFLLLLFSVYMVNQKALARTSITRTAGGLENIKQLLGAKKYIEINLFELFDMCDRKELDKLKNSYTMRGIVYKTPELEKRGQFGLLRVTMWCCVGCATAYGFKIPYDKLELLKNGEWIKVCGKLKNVQYKYEEKEVKNELASNTSVREEWIFEADELEKIDAPENPYITYWSKKEPFFY